MLNALAVDRWAEYWGDGLNPILVKETRQVFKTHFVTIPFLGALLFAWFVSLSYVMEPVDPQSILGPQLFARLLVVLSIALFYVVPYISFRSMAAERDRYTFELLASSALSDTQIFWGKFYSALVLIGLFEAAFAPFMSMTYLLRGLSVFDIVAALVVITSVAVMLSLFGLMLGALATQLHWQIMNTLLLLGGSTIAALILAEYVAFTMFTGGGANLNGMACFLVLFAGWPGLFFGAVTLASLRPPTFGVVRSYIGYDDLPPIVYAADELADTIERHVPLRPVSITRNRKKVPVARDALQSLLPVVVRLERLLNPRQRRFTHLGRYRYLTIKGAAESLERICTVQNMVLLRFDWSAVCVADADTMPNSDDHHVYPISPGELQSLKEAVVRLRDVLNRDAPTELEEAGFLSSRPAPDQSELPSPSDGQR